jgi:hypothetical protein
MASLLDVEAGARPRPAVVTRPAPFWNLQERFAQMSLPGLARSMETGDLYSSALATTEIGVALRRFRLDHGAYPADLSALVPQYLARVPIDPFTGQPPMYARRDAGFTLHSQGGAHFTQHNSALDWTVAQ